MKIQLASDLHLEFLRHKWPGEKLIAPASGADVLVLAGDIAQSVQAFELFADWPLPVIYVAGNHEFYGGSYPARIEKMRQKSAPNSNIHFLENETVVIGETRFIGAILWTDYRLRQSPTQSMQMEYAERKLNDHHLIHIGQRTFTARDALARHEYSRELIERGLKKPWAGKTVVVTHHGPHPLSVHPRYAGDVLSSAFVSDLSEILEGEHAPDLWLHGHVHDGFDYTVGKTRVVANPAGYIRNTYEMPSEFDFENPTFNRELVVQA